MRAGEGRHGVPHGLGLPVGRAVVDGASVPPGHPAGARRTQRLQLQRERVVRVEVHLVPPGAFQPRRGQVSFLPAALFREGLSMILERRAASRETTSLPTASAFAERLGGRVGNDQASVVEPRGHGALVVHQAGGRVLQKLHRRVVRGLRCRPLRRAAVGPHIRADSGVAWGASLVVVAVVVVAVPGGAGERALFYY
jgi:hypothetical protein